MTTTSELAPQSPIACHEQSIIDRIADFEDPRQAETPRPRKLVTPS
jgi:hypothetical protein